MELYVTEMKSLLYMLHSIWKIGFWSSEEHSDKMKCISCNNLENIVEILSCKDCTIQFTIMYHRFPIIPRATCYFMDIIGIA